jgi:pimeloyl-ACP methyl ester carboxylesterase
MDRLRIPIWQEARVALERAALRRDPVLRGQGVPRGDGAPVLLVPGFLAGDLTLSVMSEWLGRLGYAPCRAGMRANVDCTTRALERLETQLENLAARHGQRVSIVGHSRGGSMARVLAVRRPDLVEGIVCLGSPLTDQLAVHPLVRAQVEAVATLGGLGVRGFFSRGCADGPCCAQARAAAAAPFPTGVRFTSVFTRSDGIVDWRTCLDPAAEHVEVHSSHCGMAVNGEVFTAIGHALVPEATFARPRSTVRAVRAAGAIAA